ADAAVDAGDGAPFEREVGQLRELQPRADAEGEHGRLGRVVGAVELVERAGDDVLRVVGVAAAGGDEDDEVVGVSDLHRQRDEVPSWFVGEGEGGARWTRGREDGEGGDVGVLREPGAANERDGERAVVHFDVRDGLDDGGEGGPGRGKYVVVVEDEDPLGKHVEHAYAGAIAADRARAAAGDAEVDLSEVEVDAVRAV